LAYSLEATLILDKNLFDAALQPGVRTALAPSNQQLRQAENETFGRLLDAQGNFLPGACLQRDCPLCKTAHESATFLMRAYGMHLVRCPSCRLVYSREVINQEFERQRYQESNASEANLALKENPAYAGLERQKASYVIGRLSAYAGSGKLLDIGSSSGALLRAGEMSGWQACGIEINAPAADLSKKNGLDVACGQYPYAMPSNWREFDAIAALDVLEHIPDPLSFLASVRDHLKPNGWLVVQVPNFSSLLLTIEGTRNNNICHGHWSYFDRYTLGTLMQESGFEIHFLETYISELDRVLAYPDAIIEAAWHNLSDSPLNAPRELTVERLHSEMLGYKLFGIFRKLST